MGTYGCSIAKLNYKVRPAKNKSLFRMQGLFLSDVEEESSVSSRGQAVNQKI